MKVQELENLINCVDKNNIGQLKIRKNKNNITIHKIIQNKYKVRCEKKINNISQQKIKDKVIQKNNNTNLKKENKEKIDQSQTYSTIVSPMVGTFYKSPAPNEPAFIEIGETVKPKQTVCIIEAMKLMNEIESEVNGDIVEILVKNGDIVDCGQALIKIRTKQ